MYKHITTDTQTQAQQYTVQDMLREAQAKPVVYLLCFEQPLGKHARHYCGFTSNLERRLRGHRNGSSGAHIMRALHDAGIPFKLVRIWKNGSRDLERALKNTHNLPRECPECKRKRTMRRFLERVDMLPTPAGAMYANEKSLFDVEPM